MAGGDDSREEAIDNSTTSTLSPRGGFSALEALPSGDESPCTTSSTQVEDLAQNPPSALAGCEAPCSLQDEAPPAREDTSVQPFLDDVQENEASGVSRGISAHLAPGDSSILEISSAESSAVEEPLPEQLLSGVCLEKSVEQPVCGDASLNSLSFDGSAKQNHASEDEELSDDVKRKMLGDVCKSAAILTRDHEGEGGSCYVYLIGTAHVSEESCREVQAATSLIKPEVVFLELCNKRRFIVERTSFQVATLSETMKAWRERRVNLMGILYGWFLEKVAAKLEVLPGSEFRVAFEEAKACGARVVLGDRDVEITLRRTWGKMNLWHKTKFVLNMLFQAIWLPSADTLNDMLKKLQDADMLTVAFEELGKSYPTLWETLVDERDMYMAAVLQRIAEYHTSVVAVVGRGHVAGITKYWGQDIHIQTLMEIPRKKSIWNKTSKLCALTACLALTSSLAYAYYHLS